ncbi:DNA (cytosine-5)-methyltransferase 1 [Nocardioides alpinus]|uniref:Cytosine-specific methyltransferase n=1 Tax=Nocardioides alpinus TaxID=748909 RepID=A0A1I1BDB7_9ACTN|nr:DNA cytosine methyltransferase [Nocardioides alpinus]PKH38453.1 DNA cytosine methyltransferase [Nocardioides alpinus]SFB48375.1 DNA (cytosine-5)-methyltransferase 1 [Nocardioides alpinus]
MSQPTVIDLFAGCGGMTVGFAAEGFEPVLAVEWDRFAAATYAANWGEHHVIPGDIAEVKESQIPASDLVIGGPPCQGFSNLGLKALDDPRNQLWREYMRFIRTARPKVFVIENVDRFSKSPEFQMLVGEVEHGLLKDYNISYGVLNAADYGVSQRRRRTIVIGSRVGRIDLPEPTHARDGARGLPTWRTVRDAIDGLPVRPDSTELPASVTEFFGEAMPGVFKSLDIHFRRNPNQLSLERYSFVPPGGGRFDVPTELLPRCWREKPTGTTDVMGRMRWDFPSHTIRTEFFKPEKGSYLHPQWVPGRQRRGDDRRFMKGDPKLSVDRVVTHYEASLIQDFPSDYLWVGSKIAIAKQIGNAVPSGLARAIARHIKPYVA